jgi:hypothetical protein
MKIGAPDFWKRVAELGSLPTTETPVSTSTNIADFWKKVADGGSLPVTSTPFGASANLPDFWMKVAIAGAVPTTSTPVAFTSQADYWAYVAANGVMPISVGNVYANAQDLWRAIAEGTSGVSDPFAGYSYYVNSVTGSDSNAGTSSLAPFATITKLLTVWQAGQSVGLAKGSTWREELLFPGNASKAYAYGASGNKPVLDASDIAAKGSITKTGGQTNVYEISVTFGSRAAENNWCSVWEDDVFLAKVASIAACDATAGTYYVAASTGTQTLYIHASDDSDVSANSKVYTYAKRISGVYGYSYSGCVLSGVICQKNLGEGGSIKMGKSPTIIGCEANYGSKHNVYVREDFTVTDVSCSKAYYNPASPSKSYFIFNDDNPTLGGTFLRCVVDNGGIIDNDAEAFYGHYNVGGGFGTINFIDCVVADMGCAYDGVHANLVFAGCAANHCNKGFWVKNAGNTYDLTDCTVGISTSTGIGVAIEGAATTTIANCTISASVGLNSQEGVRTSVAGLDLTITGTTTFQNLVYGIRCTSGNGTINVSGGDFIGMVRNYDTASGGPTITSDFNRFRAATQDFNIQDVLYGDVAAYQAGTGQDANSTVG